MNDFVESIDGDDLDLENLKRQVAYTFLDAYGNTDGADILFELIVKATEQRIIKMLEVSKSNTKLDDAKYQGINKMSILPNMIEVHDSRGVLQAVRNYDGVYITARAAQLERELIIKLLEDNNFSDAADFIKGKNK